MREAILSKKAAESLGLAEMTVVQYQELVNGVAHKVFHKGTLIADEIPISKETGLVNLEEDVLPDDYPVHVGYWYVANNTPLQSPVQGTVLILKGQCEILGMKNVVIKRCDTFKRRIKLKWG